MEVWAPDSCKSRIDAGAFSFGSKDPWASEESRTEHKRESSKWPRYHLSSTTLSSIRDEKFVWWPGQASRQFGYVRGLHVCQEYYIVVNTAENTTSAVFDLCFSNSACLGLRSRPS